MSDAIIRPFDFHRNGHACRRDSDARPHNLVIGMDLVEHVVWYHPAGDEFVRGRHVFDVLADEDFVNAFEPMEAARIALEYARAERIMRDREIRALEAAKAEA